MRNFTRFAAKIPEHTQGVDRGGNLGCIYQDILHSPCPTKGHILSNQDFAKVHNLQKNVFPGADDSWLEARFFNTLAIQAVPPSHPLFAPLQVELAALVPVLPEAPMSWRAELPPTVRCQGKINTASLNFTTAGSIASLDFGTESGAWHELMDLRYITFGANESGTAWEPMLLGFSSDENTADRLAERCKITIEVGFNNTLHEERGAPLTALVVYELNPDSKLLNASLTWKNKSATLLPEALTLFSRPAQRAGYQWNIDSLGEWVSLSNVSLGGERYKHAAWSGIRYSSIAADAAALYISTLDAGMICPVLNETWASDLTREAALQQSCFEYGNRHDELSRPVNDTTIAGLGINLHNNRMGISGFAEWYPFGVGDRYQKQDETGQFRFVIEEQ